MRKNFAGEKVSMAVAKYHLINIWYILIFTETSKYVICFKIIFSFLNWHFLDDNLCHDLATR